MIEDARKFSAAVRSPGIERLLSEREWLMRFARTLCADPHDADDLVQETLLAGLRRGPREPKRLRAWLGAVLRNASRRLRRATSRRRVHESKAEPPEPMPSAADAIERASWRRDVVDAVLRLPEPYRTALVLRYLEDRTPAEIGALDGVSAVTVRSRVHRGLEMVRRDLDARHGGRNAWRLAMLAWFLPRPEAIAAPAGSAGAGGVAGKTALAGSLGALVAVTAIAVQGPGAGDGVPTAIGRAFTERAAEPVRVAAAAVPPGVAAGRGSATRAPVPAWQDPERRATLRVVDEEGDAVAGATVEVWPSAYAVETVDAATVQAILSGRIRPRPAPVEPLARAVSGDGGRASVVLPDGAGHLVVTTADGRTSGCVPTLRGEGERTVVVFRRCLVEGAVLDPEGHAVPDVRVSLHWVGGRAGPGIPMTMPRDPAPVWTGADGRFLAWVDPHALFGITAAHDGHRWETARFWADPGARVAVTLRALGTAQLDVELVDPAGDPVLGGRLRVVAVDPGAEPGGVERFTGRDTDTRGRYVVPLPGAGTYHITAAGPDLACSAPVEVELDEGERSAHVRIALPEAGVLRGRLVTPAGVPLADVELVARIDRGALPWPLEIGAPEPAATTRARSDHDGAFDLVDVHPRFRYDLDGVREPDGSRFRIAASEPVGGAERCDFVVAADQLAGAVARVELAFPARRRVPGSVLCSLWERHAETWRQTRPDEELALDGRTVTLEGLDAGREYALVVHADGCAPAVHGPWTCRRFADTVDVALTEPSTLEVRVVDASGRPVEGAQVRAARDGALPLDALPVGARTDALGIATLRGLTPGTHRVRAGTDLGATGAADAALRAGERTVVEVRVR